MKTDLQDPFCCLPGCLQTPKLLVQLLKDRFQSICLLR